MTELFRVYGKNRYCKAHFETNCIECTREEELRNQIEKEKNDKMSGKKPFMEVKAIEVHRVLTFLNNGRNIVKKVKCCPKCFMPNLIGSGSGNYQTATVICDTCDSMWLNPDKELMELNVDDYVSLIKSLPLVNRGQIILSLQEKQLYKDAPPVTYDDLTEEDLHRYDNILN